ncbi:hypothetical protein ZYGM_003168 [Zygosaccharomyces mellis]|uniref:Rab-GAP TBC domain-containing protein n=1 Tax=Zygosaccharomyces mellis TaxID=42258 RepID=A0A4C2EC26_9SACH|nr:hypothetical protein ZYGM_003168 [Zygosaccharomyces mellis]
MDLKQVAVDRYGSRDELIQRGIWRGELYRYTDTDKGRGWLWKVLVAEEQLNSGHKYNKRPKMHVRRLTPPALPILTPPLEKPVIELDLGRLNDSELLEPKVQKILLELMIRVLTIHNWTYKQGFHELLGTVWLQLREPHSTMTVFEKLMEQVVPIFYDESSRDPPQLQRVGQFSPGFGRVVQDGVQAGRALVPTGHHVAEDDLRHLPQNTVQR